MSLNVYFSKADVPEKLRIIEKNDAYFNGGTTLADTPLVRQVLWEIDMARYCNDNGFYGRSSNVALSRDRLSTGAKTLINIIQHPNVCFSVVECGGNALCFLQNITEGFVLWENPVVSVSHLSNPCDILCQGRHFTEFVNFLEYALTRED